MNFFRNLVSALSCAALLAACAGTPAPGGSGAVPEGHYRVQRGDTLYRIGQRFGQSAATLAAWNQLRDPSQIEVGQILRVRPQGRSSNNTARSGNVSVSRPTSRTAAPSRLQWPVRGDILSRFNGTSNKGIDIGGQAGTPVQAAAAGRVSYAGEGLRGYGKLILINHGGGMLTAYAHNQSLQVREGEQVSAGQTIARMGDTGTDRVKLHFEVRLNNRAVNPLDYLPN
ncbi:murein hydrolase activator EnvC family protein [Neisseria shayeganii]|uniref:Peptidoglycan DD-metalloendopeptidase family protein n=1 Tax=Neisseria shayeganii TaxID=607712 RepID=A0A7D7NBP7_9NEIS|nr:peptidoglycan DD-metalloendopeptidase family protein [Neisseria shayeganii]QMT40516.1 peptidoglycan DD-metalloendopeptidase family protein [Neisseria shayeganii]